jgi:hypothetical protein
MGGPLAMKIRTEEELNFIKKSWQMTNDGILMWITGRKKGLPVCLQTSKRGGQTCNLLVNQKLIGYSVGQIAWFLYYGEWPNGEIDHIDTNASNHKKENLRIANRQQQSINRVSGKKGRMNKGVYKRSYGNKWMAQIWIDGKCKCLGTYDTEEEAVQVRIEATKSLHGKFANLQSYRKAA